MWGFIAVPVALVCAAWGVWATRRSDTERRLLYSMPSATALLTDLRDVRAQLEVRREGEVLKDPHVAVLRITAQGRKDIVVDDFQGSPLTLDVSAPLLACLAIESEPADNPKPLVEFDGTSVRIGPAMIHHGQTVTISVLVDGEPVLEKPTRTLANVNLKRDTVIPATLMDQMMNLTMSVAAVGVVYSSSEIALGNPDPIIAGMALFLFAFVFFGVGIMGLKRIRAASK